MMMTGPAGGRFDVPAPAGQLAAKSRPTTRQPAKAASWWGRCSRLSAGKIQVAPERQKYGLGASPAGVCATLLSRETSGRSLSYCERGGSSDFDGSLSILQSIHI